MVQQADANGVKLTYLQQSGDSSAITSGPQYAGDQVTGLSVFGQVIDQNWVNTTTTPTPTTTDRFQYNYDQNGNVLDSNNLVNPSESELYHSNSTTSGDSNSAYDPLNRLTAFARGTLSASSHNSGVLDTVSSPSATQNWTLDAVGNQAAVTTNGTTVDNTANSKNALTANGSNSLTFDNNGNTVTDQSGNTFTYDAWNHIAVAKNSGGTTIATYTYAANGDRITETASGTTTAFYYKGPQIIEQRQGSTVTRQNVFNIDYVNDLLLRDDNSTSGSLGISGSGLGRRLFSQHDANFDVTALTNTSGVVQERFIYSPYGTVTVLSPSWTSTTDSFGWGYLYQGMWRDSVTGLYYTPNRDYDPATGTWREADPLGYPDGNDQYAFALAAPASGLDPMGTATEQAERPFVDQNGVAHIPVRSMRCAVCHGSADGSFVNMLGYHDGPVPEAQQIALGQHAGKVVYHTDPTEDNFLSVYWDYLFGGTWGGGVQKSPHVIGQNIVEDIQRTPEYATYLNEIIHNKIEPHFPTTPNSPPRAYIINYSQAWGGNTADTVFTGSIHVTWRATVYVGSGPACNGQFRSGLVTKDGAPINDISLSATYDKIYSFYHKSQQGTGGKVYNGIIGVGSDIVSLAHAQDIRLHGEWPEDLNVPCKTMTVGAP
jgi:RHS repeat-associated protein